MLKTFAGGRLFGASYGDEPPWVLALHGWQRTHRDFDQVCSSFDAVALDLAGFGSTPPPPDPWSTAEYAQQVAAILEEMAAKVVLVGHSFGGRVAVHLAAAHPQRVRAQVLTGVPLIRKPAAGGHSGPLSLRLAKALRKSGVVSEAQVERLRQKYGSEDYRRAQGVMRTVLVKAVNETYEDCLAAFPGPIELVWGAEDNQAPVAVAEKARAYCAQPNVVILPGVGHFVPQERPDAVIEAIARHRPGGR